MYLNNYIYNIRNFIVNTLFYSEIKGDSFGLKNNNIKYIYLSEILNFKKKNYLIKNSLKIESDSTYGYYTLINSMFFMILFINVIGIFPYFFSISTHVSMTIGMSLTIILFCLLNSLMMHFDHFFASFTPQNSPIALAPLLSIIETISFIARIISLGVRLAANICAGHLLISIISMFGYACTFSSYWFILSVLPSIILIFVILLEICVAFIQSYIFIVLSIIYIEESFNINSNHVSISLDAILEQETNKMIHINKI